MSPLTSHWIHPCGAFSVHVVLKVTTPPTSPEGEDWHRLHVFLRENHGSGTFTRNVAEQHWVGASAASRMVCACIRETVYAGETNAVHTHTRLQRLFRRSKQRMP